MKWPNGHALILAAGKGTRLLPVTNYIPKPLFPLLGSPAIERIVKILSVPGIVKIAINVFHLRDQILHWADSFKQQDIKILLEQELLGTGGAVKNAFDHLGYQRPLLIYNGDIVSNIDPVCLLRRYYELGSPLSLLCVHWRPPFNKLHVQKDEVLSFDSSSSSALAYTGISVISPELFRKVPLRPCSLVEVWQEAIRQGGSIKAIPGKTLTRTSDETWMWEDIGTPCGYLEGNWLLCSKRKKLIAPQALLGSNLQLQGRIIIGEEAIIGNRSVLKDCIIWPNARVPENACIEKSIITPYGTLICQDE